MDTGLRSYPIPPDETGRLAELDRYQILDTPEEYTFNHITELASRILDVPIALVSLIADERQWFKAKVGLSVCETARDVAFCTYTILDEDALIVADATQDPRFCNNPLVTGPPDIRFYAGAPLMTPNGHKLGTLCLIDTNPRACFAKKDEQTLKDLAALVMDQFELRRAEAERRQLESALVQQKRDLEKQKANLETALEKEKELSGLQRQFVSMVTHELRTPLAIIDGNAHRLLRLAEYDATGQTEKATEKIRRSVARLVDLMESVLSASRLEAGTVKFAPEVCDPAQLIADVVGSYIELHPDRQISVDVKQLPEGMTMDVKLMRQVFSNLISNAIKYSPEGGMIQVRGETDANGTAIISFIDEGVGIPEAELEKLFGRFFRASTSAGIAGSGIGLHMVKALVDMHDGQIEVSSEAGEGSKFSVLLPRHQSPI